jgi:hypothetical protein
VSAGDGVHVNDLGHNYLFIRVRDKQVFALNIPLPLLLKDFQAYSAGKTVVLKWHTDQEYPNTFFEIQRSSDGLNFESLYRLMARGSSQGDSYSWTDVRPLTGKSFYRLKITETNRESYSKTLVLINKAGDLTINKLYKDNSSSTLIADIGIQKSQSVVIRIINVAGIVIQQQSQYITSPSKIILLPIEKLPAGQYFLSIRTSDNNSATSPFNK